MTYYSETSQDVITSLEKARVIGQGYPSILAVQLVSSFNSVLTAMGSGKLSETGKSGADTRVIITIANIYFEFSYTYI
jgi:hypothetical protein